MVCTQWTKEAKKDPPLEASAKHLCRSVGFWSNHVHLKVVIIKLVDVFADLVAVRGRMAKLLYEIEQPCLHSLGR